VHVLFSWCCNCPPNNVAACSTDGARPAAAAGNGALSCVVSVMTHHVSVAQKMASAISDSRRV